jgi:integrase
MSYPDGSRKPAPSTFDTKGHANAWLKGEFVKIAAGEWTPEDRAASVAITFEDYSAKWLKRRKVKGRALADRTREGYQDLLDRFLLPTFGQKPVHLITSDLVENWYDKLPDDRPTYKSKAYSLMRTLMHSAVEDGHLTANPCHIRGAGSVERRHQTRILEEDELDVLTEAMPPRYRALVQLAYWTGLRFGELTELRRKDLDMKRGILQVRRAVVLAGGEFIVKKPKSAAGIRDLMLPEDVMPVLRTHLLEHAAPGPDGLLFPSAHDPEQHLRQSALTRVFYPARTKAKREDFRWHDFRHTHLTNYARYATPAQTMARGGHSTAAVSLRYQHAAQNRDAEVMALMSRKRPATESDSKQA